MGKIQTSAVSLMRMTMYECVHLILSVVCLHQKLIFKGTNACTDMVFCSNGLISNNTYLCYRQDIQYKCCKSCKNAYIDIQGCEYGDKLPVCTEPYCISGLFNETDCCLTCRAKYPDKELDDSKMSNTTTEDNVTIWNHRSINESPPPQADLGRIIGGVVGVIAFLIIVIPIGYIVWKKVSRRQEEAEHLIQNRPAVPVPVNTSRPTVPLRIMSLRTERNNTSNRSSVHTYDFPDNGYIDVYPTFQMSCNVPDTANRHNVSMDTRSYASVGSPMYLSISNGDGLSTENVIQPLTQTSHERTAGYLTVVAEYNGHRY